MIEDFSTQSIPYAKDLSLFSKHPIYTVILFFNITKDINQIKLIVENYRFLYMIREVRMFNMMKKYYVIF